MKNKQKVSLLCALLILGSTVTACGGEAAKTNDPKTDDQNKTPETEAVAWYDRTDLAETDWGGRDFHVLGWDDFIPNFEIYAEAENGEVVNDAIYRRNRMIEEKYNATISQQLEYEVRSVLEESVWADEHLFDLAILPLEQISACTVNGYFYDLKEVPNVNTTKPYWNQFANDQLEVMNRLVVATSDFLLSDKRRVYLMLYNPSLASQYEIPSIVDSVRAGKWTADLMNSYMKMIPADLNGDSKMDYTDQWALGMDSYNGFASFYYGFDNQIVSKDKDGNFTFTMNTPHSVDSIDKVVNLVCDRSNSFFCEDWDGIVDNCWAVVGDTFYSGRSLFATLFAQVFNELSERADFDYTVIPYPKLDESQERYTTLADTYSELFGIPVTSDDPSFAGFMIEALSAAATDTSLYAYYDIACKTKYSYNEVNSEMLDLIFDGVIYEKALIYSIGELFYILSWDLPDARSNIFTSCYTSLEAGALKDLQNLQTEFADTYGQD